MMTTQFTLSEASLIVDAMNGIIWTDGITKQSHLYHNVRGAIEVDSLDEKWDLHADDMLTRLHDFTEAEAAEVLDKVTAFWHTSSHTPDIEFGLSQCQLIPYIGWEAWQKRANEAKANGDDDEAGRCYHLSRDATEVPLSWVDAAAPVHGRLI